MSYLKASPPWAPSLVLRLIKKFRTDSRKRTKASPAPPLHTHAAPPPLCMPGESRR